MKHKLVMMLLMLGISAPLHAQGGNIAKGNSAYPKITAEDLALCKKEIADLHREAINYIKIDVEKYCVHPSKNDHPDNCKNAKNWLSESSTQSNLAWFMEGSTSCADGYVCYGLSTYNENPNEDFINTILKTPVPVFDEAKERTRAQKDSSEHNLKYNTPPQEALYFENREVQEAKLFGLSLAADKCIAKIWVAKRNGKTPVAVTEKQPGRKPAENSSQANDGGSKPLVAGATRLSQQQISACTEDIKRKQTESQSWGGDVDAVANRLGKYQKELFEGRCAGHPEAQVYLAGANKMLGYGGESSPVAGANLASSMSFIPALTGPQVSVVKAEMAAGTGGPEYVRIQSNKKCAAYKITETPDAVSKFKKVVFGIKNTCDIPMYIRWEVYEGKHLTNMVDYPNQLDLTPSRNAYFKPGETLTSKPFSVSSRDPVKIVFNQVCPIESEASRMAGKPLGNIHARPEQPDLCIGLVLKPTDVPTAK